jgi:hypothetical protein
VRIGALNAAEIGAMAGPYAGQKEGHRMPLSRCLSKHGERRCREAKHAVRYGR